MAAFMLLTKCFQSSSPPHFVGKYSHVTALGTEMPLLGGRFKGLNEIQHSLCPSVHVDRNVSINPHGSHSENNIKQICNRCGVSKK